MSDKSDAGWPSDAAATSAKICDNEGDLTATDAAFPSRTAAAEAPTDRPLAHPSTPWGGECCIKKPPSKKGRKPRKPKVEREPSTQRLPQSPPQPPEQGETAYYWSGHKRPKLRSELEQNQLWEGLPYDTVRSKRPGKPKTAGSAAAEAAATPATASATATSSHDESRAANAAVEAAANDGIAAAVVLLPPPPPQPVAEPARLDPLQSSSSDLISRCTSAAVVETSTSHEIDTCRPAIVGKEATENDAREQQQQLKSETERHETATGAAGLLAGSVGATGREALAAGAAVAAATEENMCEQPPASPSPNLSCLFESRREAKKKAKDSVIPKRSPRLQQKAQAVGLGVFRGDDFLYTKLKKSNGKEGKARAHSPRAADQSESGCGGGVAHQQQTALSTTDASASNSASDAVFPSSSGGVATTGSADSCPKKKSSRKRQSGTKSEAEDSLADGHPSEDDARLSDFAYLLWSSERRSQLEKDNPGLSEERVDAIMLSTWQRLGVKERSPYILRARSAVADSLAASGRTSSAGGSSAATAGAAAGCASGGSSSSGRAPRRRTKSKGGRAVDAASSKTAATLSASPAPSTTTATVLTAADAATTATTATEGPANATVTSTEETAALPAVESAHAPKLQKQQQQRQPQRRTRKRDEAGSSTRRKSRPGATDEWFYALSGEEQNAVLRQKMIQMQKHMSKAQYLIMIDEYKIAFKNAKDAIMINTPGSSDPPVSREHLEDISRRLLYGRLKHYEKKLFRRSSAAAAAAAATAAVVIPAAELSQRISAAPEQPIYRSADLAASAFGGFSSSGLTHPPGLLNSYAAAPAAAADSTDELGIVLAAIASHEAKNRQECMNIGILKSSVGGLRPSGKGLPLTRSASFERIMEDLRSCDSQTTMIVGNECIAIPRMKNVQLEDETLSSLLDVSALPVLSADDVTATLDDPFDRPSTFNYSVCPTVAQPFANSLL